MNCRVINIERVVRKMRGGSQAHLVQGSDGNHYVAKFVGNPQGTRTLINEWIATHTFRRLGVTTPDLVVLRFDPSIRLMGVTPTVTVGDHRLSIGTGLHLGSLCPVNPDKHAIYDFLPTHLVGSTVNLPEFAKVLVLDTFLGQADSRQAVFARDRSRRELSFRAYFIDHGLAFGGSKWALDDLAGRPLYFDRKVYSMIDMSSVCEEAIDLLASISEDELYRTVQNIPNEWFETGDFDHLAKLFIMMLKRRERIRTLVSEQLAILGLDILQKSNMFRGARPKAEDRQTVKLDVALFTLPGSVAG
jgi:hypothetical protein